MTGMLGCCCARATTGQMAGEAAAVPPSPAMKSRRRILHLSRWFRGAYPGGGCKGTGSPRVLIVCCSRTARLVAATRSGCRPLLDQLVGDSEHARRNFQAERPGGLQVDDELAVDRRLHRQVARLLTLEDAIDVTCCLLHYADGIGRAVCHQAANL